MTSNSSRIETATQYNEKSYQTTIQTNIDTFINNSTRAIRKKGYINKEKYASNTRLLVINPYGFKLEN